MVRNPQALGSFSPREQGHDYMDVVGRATQEAKAEDEGLFLRCLALTPTLSTEDSPKEEI